MILVFFPSKLLETENNNEQKRVRKRDVTCEIASVFDLETLFWLLCCYFSSFFFYSSLSLFPYNFNVNTPFFLSGLRSNNGRHISKYKNRLINLIVLLFSFFYCSCSGCECVFFVVAVDLICLQFMRFESNLRHLS